MSVHLVVEDFKVQGRHFIENGLYDKHSMT